MSLVSVVVPMFNNELVIERCLNSIVNQSYQLIEVIMIDDGSCDDTSVIAKKFQKLDSRFHLITLHKNSGAGHARNVGIQHAKGEYICFIDSDDLVSPHYIANLVTAITRFNADLAISSLSTDLSNTVRTDDHKMTCLTGEAYLKKLFLHEIPVSFSSKLYKKKLMLPISEKRYFEDMDWCYRYALKVKTVAVSHTLNYFYIVREHSLSNVIYTDKQLSMFENCADVCHIIQQEKKHLVNYAAFYAFGHLKYQLVEKQKYLGQYEKDFFKVAQQYSRHIWNISNFHMKCWIVSVNSGYTIFKIFRKFHKKVFKILFMIRLLLKKIKRKK